MCGRRPHCKRNLACGLRSGASHVSGLLVRHMPLALMCSADRVPIKIPGSKTPIDPRRVLPIDGSTVSHHAIITLAIAMRASTRSLPLYRQPI